MLQPMRWKPVGSDVIVYSNQPNQGYFQEFDIWGGGTEKC